MRAVHARHYGRPLNWGRCFSLDRKAGRFELGERVRITLSDDFGVEWCGIAECFGVTPRQDGRTVYDFEKIGDATWLRREVANAD